MPITVTARVAVDVTHIDAVTLTARVKTAAPSGDVTLAQSRASLAVDNAPPVVRIDLPRGATMRSGPQTVTGSASDASGVGFVEVRMGDGPWRVMPGPGGGVFQTQAWAIGIDAPASDSFVVQARGHDIFGQTSEPVSATVLVDNTPPTASLSLPSNVVHTSSVELRGTTRDSLPADGVIQRVEVQMDDSEWQIAPAPYPLLPVALSPIGVRSWRMTCRVSQEEGVKHRLRVRAVDAAGNVGAHSQPVTVDNVAPTSTLDYPAAGATVPETCLNVGEGSILVWGTARDGWAVGSVQVSVDGGQTWTNARLGPDATALLAATLCRDATAGAGKVDAGATLWAAVVAASDPQRVRHTSTPSDRPYRLYLPTIESRAARLR